MQQSQRVGARAQASKCRDLSKHCLHEEQKECHPIHPAACKTPPCRLAPPSFCHVCSCGSGVRWCYGQMAACISAIVAIPPEFTFPHVHIGLPSLQYKLRRREEEEMKWKLDEVTKTVCSHIYSFAMITRARSKESSVFTNRPRLAEVV